MVDELATVLNAVGPRLRGLRQERGGTLAQLAEATGISVSTLSRLESGQRKPTLELLLPLAKAYQVQLDELVGAPATGDPRIHPQPFKRHGSTFVPLSRHPGGLQAYKMIIPAIAAHTEPTLGVHEGYEWVYVLTGKLRLLLGDRDLVLKVGEAAEFDTHVPHAFSVPARGRSRSSACSDPRVSACMCGPSRKLDDGMGQTAWPAEHLRVNTTFG